MSAAIEDMNPAATAAQTRPTSTARYVFVDVWRGLAIIGVVAYHFGWDLNFFGFIPSSAMFSGPVTAFARILAGSFMFLVGVSLVLAHDRNIHWRKFLKRLAKLVVAAVAISLITYFLFPEGFIYFGILHSIAVASVLGLAFLPLPITIADLLDVLGEDENLNDPHDDERKTACCPHCGSARTTLLGELPRSGIT